MSIFCLSHKKIVAIIALVLAVSACGQKGPLTRPQPERAKPETLSVELVETAPELSE